MTNANSQSSLELSASEFLVEAGMLFAAGTSAVLFVEGDSDRRLYQGMFKNAVSIIPTNSFINVQNVIELYDGNADKTVFPKILGVVDRDYRIAAGEIPNSDNLICTHLRDIECEMIETVAFDNVVNEFCSKKFQSTWKHINEFRSLIMRTVSTVGEIRLYNHLKKCGISFQQLKFEKFVDLKSHNLDQQRLIDHLRGAQKSGTQFPANFKEISLLVGAKQYAPHTSVLRLSRGHDIFELVSLYFKKGYCRNGIDLDASILESAIRVGFKPLMKTSPTVKKIMAWFAQCGLQATII